MVLQLQQIATHIDAKIIGNPLVEISKIAPLDKAKNGDITFLSDKKYAKKLIDCKATAVIVDQKNKDFVKNNALIVDNPYVAYAKLTQLMDTTPQVANNISKSANIDPSAVIGKNVSIGHNSIIEENAIIADNVQIGANCFIGKKAIISKNTKLWANISIYHDVEIGQNCLIQSGSVIGSDGFGYANDKGQWIKIAQLGSVKIGNNVEIGANTCIDRGALEDTIIGNNIIIDNLCQIAHNVNIGDGTAIAGGVVIAGSTTIGKYCIIGGASVFNGHITIADHTHISGMAMIMRSIKEPGIYSSGIPAQPNKEWRKTASRALRINDIYNRLKHLENTIKK